MHAEHRVKYRQTKSVLTTVQIRKKISIYNKTYVSKGSLPW